MIGTVEESPKQLGVTPRQAVDEAAEDSLAIADRRKYVTNPAGSELRFANSGLVPKRPPVRATSDHALDLQATKHRSHTRIGKLATERTLDFAGEQRRTVRPQHRHHIVLKRAIRSFGHKTHYTIAALTELSIPLRQFVVEYEKEWPCAI